MAYESKATLTRAANTTAYTANDVVGGLITFENAGPYDGNAMVIAADLMAYIDAVPAGMSTFRMFFFNAAPATIADNAAFNIAAADRTKYLGYIDLSTAIDAGDTVVSQSDGPPNRPVKTKGGYTLYAYLVTIAGYTPAANSEVYVPRVHLIDLANDQRG